MTLPGMKVWTINSSQKRQRLNDAEVDKDYDKSSCILLVKTKWEISSKISSLKGQGLSKDEVQALASSSLEIEEVLHKSCLMYLIRVLDEYNKDIHELQNIALVSLFEDICKFYLQIAIAYNSENINRKTIVYALVKIAQGAIDNWHDQKDTLMSKNGRGFTNSGLAKDQPVRPVCDNMKLVAVSRESFGKFNFSLTQLSNLACWAAPAAHRITGKGAQTFALPTCWSIYRKYDLLKYGGLIIPSREDLKGDLNKLRGIVATKDRTYEEFNTVHKLREEVAIATSKSRKAVNLDKNSIAAALSKKFPVACPEVDECTWNVLPRRSYLKVGGYFDLEVCEQLLKAAKERSTNFTGISNNEGDSRDDSDKAIMDSKRQHNHIDPTIQPSHHLNKLKKHMREVYPYLRVNQWSYLRAEADCTEQGKCLLQRYIYMCEAMQLFYMCHSLISELHRDFGPHHYLRGLTPGVDLPCSILLALENDTKWIHFDESSGSKITETMSAGDLLVFTADCVHAGAAYEQENYRIHAYFSLPGDVDQEDEAPDFCSDYLELARK